MSKYRARDDKEFKELFGLGSDDVETADDEPDQGLEFADGAKQDPTESWTDPDDETEDEAPKPTTRDDSAEMPPWMKVLSQRVDETAQEARAARQEAQQARQEAYQRQQQRQQQQAQPEPEEAFWADSSYVNEVAQKIENARREDMRDIHRVSLTQEWQNCNGIYDALAAQLAQDPDMPKLEDVIPRDRIRQTFEQFAKNPRQFGGFGQDWMAHYQGAFKQNAQPYLLKALKDERAKSDQLAKKREQKKVENSNNLTKVARSGSVVQEPKPQSNKRTRRDYRHSSVRNAALNYIQNSGD